MEIRDCVCILFGVWVMLTLDEIRRQLLRIEAQVTSVEAYLITATQLDQ